MCWSISLHFNIISYSIKPITLCSKITKHGVDRVNFQKMLTLKANHVNLGHTNFLGVLRGAEPKSSVCPAEQCP